MNIIRPSYTWSSSLAYRTKTDYIVLHHRAGNGDVLSIHDQHLKQGWSGIGYHYYIRKNGAIYGGRPESTKGAHCINYNSNSIGVCFEGNYETETTMPPAQIRAGQELISYLRGKYPSAKVVGHRDLYATACPGKYFPSDTILSKTNQINQTPKKEDEVMTQEKAIQTLINKAGLSDTTITFLQCYKYGNELIIKLAEAINKGV